MDKLSHSFGKMETYEPDDKSFTKHVLQDGFGNLKPNEGSICKVYMTLIENKGEQVTEEMMGEYIFDKDVEITIGEGDAQLSDLFDRVVCSMIQGERAYVKSKVDLNGVTISEMDLLKVSFKFNMTLKSFDRAADITDLEKDECLDRAQHHKDKGTQLYTKGRVKYSVKRYENSLKYLGHMEPIDTLPELLSSQHATLKCQCYLNLGACFLKTEEYEKVKENCSKALELDSSNVKGLYRRAQAFIKLNDYDKAKQDLITAKNIDSNNKVVVNELSNVELLIKKEKAMYQKMFS